MTLKDIVKERFIYVYIYIFIYIYVCVFVCVHPVDISLTRVTRFESLSHPRLALIRPSMERILGCSACTVRNNAFFYDAYMRF